MLYPGVRGAGMIREHSRRERVDILVGAHLNRHAVARASPAGLREINQRPLEGKDVISLAHCATGEYSPAQLALGNVNHLIRIGGLLPRRISGRESKQGVLVKSFANHLWKSPLTCLRREALDVPITALPGSADALPRCSAQPCAPEAPAALASGIFSVWPATTRSLVRPLAALRAWTVVLWARAIRPRVSPDLTT